MKKIIVALFAASSLLIGAPLPAMAGVDVAAVCDGAVPDAWKRPGGFCDQSDVNKSLSEPPSGQGCVPVVVGMIGSDRDARMLLAVSLDPCRTRCTSITEELMFQGMPRDRIVMTAC
jgi:hypothetical protein